MKKLALGIGAALLCVGLGVVGVTVKSALDHYRKDHDDYHRLMEWAVKVSKAADKAAAK